MVEYYYEHTCVIGFVWNESGVLTLIYGLELLDGGIVAWELDVWDKGVGYGVRDMKLVWDRRNSMSLVRRSHGCVVYIIKIRIQVRIAS